MGSEMAQVHDDATRTHCSLINAYTHTRLASALFQAEDMLKYDEGWDGPLLVGHINGGVARVGKTKALDTIESGPVFGTYASAFLARRYALSDVVCLDVGGTTAKASVVLGGEPMFTRDGDIFDIPVRASLPLLRSAVLGGGSVARPASANGAGSRIRLGPDSMGAAPGPACYGLGGDQATVTDAFLILGYLDPSRFLGGRRTLDVARAEEVLTKQLAEPLGVTVEEAAAMVADTAVGIVAELVSSTLAKAGLDPADVTLFAYGGNGSMFAAPVAERLGIQSARVFGLGPVFAAFGSSVSDVVHVYERSVSGEADAKAAADELVAMARRDLVAEGFDHDVATIDVEVDEVARVRARFPVGAYEPRGHPSRDASTAPAPLVRRPVSLGGVRHQAAVYDWGTLTGRAAVEGPAVAVGETMTCLVPPGWSLAIDEFANGVLRRA